MAANTPNGVNPGQSQVNLRLSSQSARSFTELADAIDQAKNNLLSLKNQYQTFMGASGIQDMKTLAGLMKQLNMGVNSIGIENRATVSANRNALFSTDRQTQAAVMNNELSAAQKLLKAEQDRQVLQEAQIRRRVTSVQQINDSETATLRLKAAEVRLAQDLENGTRSQIATSRNYLTTLQARTEELSKQERLQARIQNQVAYQQARQQAGLNNPPPPKTPAQIAQEQQDARLNKVQGILGDGGGAIFAVQAGLLANYQIMNGLTSAFKYAIQFTTELDSAFHELQAITGATNTEMVSMRENLLQVASNSKFTAQEVAQAAVVLGQAGLSVAQIKDAMSSITALAAASGTDLKKATDTLTSVMGAFNMSSNQSKEIADTLTQALNISKLDIDKLSMGIQYAGNTAQQSGVSFKEMTAVLGALSNAGIKSGSTLGTGLRQIIIDIEKPTANFQKVLDRLGLSLADVDIKSHGLTGVLQTLHDAGFNSADAFQSFEVRAAAAFSALNGNLDNVKEMQAALDRSDAVAKANEVQMESYAAQSSRLKSNLGVLISTALQPLLNVFTGLTKAFADITGSTTAFSTTLQVFGTVIGGAIMGTAIAQMGKLLIGLKDIVFGLMEFPKAAAAFDAGAGVIKAAMIGLTESTLLMGGVIGAVVIGIGTLAYALSSHRDALSQAKDAEDKATAASNQYKAALQDKQQSITQVNSKIDELVNKQNHLKESDGSLHEQVRQVEEMFVKFGTTLDSNAKSSVPNLIAALRNLRKELGLAESLAQLNQSLTGTNIAQRVTLKQVIEGVTPDQFNPERGILGSLGADGMGSVNSTRGIDAEAWKKSTKAKAGDINGLAGDVAAIQNYAQKPYTMDQVKDAITKANAILQDLGKQYLAVGDNKSEEKRVVDAQVMVNKTLDWLQAVQNKNKEIIESGNAIHKNKDDQAAIERANAANGKMPAMSSDEMTALVHRRMAAEKAYDASVDRLNNSQKPQKNGKIDMAAIEDANYGVASAAWDDSMAHFTDAQPNSRLRMFNKEAKVAEQNAKMFMNMYSQMNEEQKQAYLEQYTTASKTLDFIKTKRADFKTKGAPLARAAASASEEALTREIQDLTTAAGKEGDPAKIQSMGAEAVKKKQKEFDLKIQSLVYQKGGEDGAKDAELDIQIKALRETRDAEVSKLGRQFVQMAQARQEKINKAILGDQMRNEDDAFKTETTQIEKGMKEIQTNLTNNLKKINQPLTNLQRINTLMDDPRYSMHYSQTERNLMAQRMREQDDALNPSRLKEINTQLAETQDKYNQTSSEAAAMRDRKTLLEKQRESYSRIYQPDDAKVKDLDTEIDKLEGRINTRGGEAANAKREVVTLTEKQLELEQKIAQVAPQQMNWQQATIEGIKLTMKSWDGNATLTDGLVGAFSKAKDATASYFDTLMTYSDEAKKKYGSFGVFMREETKSMMRSILQSVLSTINQLLAQQAWKALAQAFGINIGGTTAAIGGSTVTTATNNIAGNIGTAVAIRGGLVTGSGIRHMAGGGLISGPIRGQDSQLILGMPGEVVMNKSAVDAVGADTLMALNAMGNSTVSKSGERIQPIDETKRNKAPVHTNVYVVTPDQKPQMGPNDVVAVINDDILRGGSTKQLIKQVVQGY